MNLCFLAKFTRPIHNFDWRCFLRALRVCCVSSASAIAGANPLHSGGALLGSGQGAEVAEADKMPSSPARWSRHDDAMAKQVCIYSASANHIQSNESCSCPWPHVCVLVIHGIYYSIIIRPFDAVS
jgi:hypothetical protein